MSKQCGQEVSKFDCFDAIDLVAVAERLGFTVKWFGGKARTQCPSTQHEHDAKEPACGLKGPVWNCFKCGEHGGVLAFVQAALSTDKAGALAWLHNEGSLPERNAANGDSVAKDPLEHLAQRRGWTREALSALGAESDAEGVIHFPMRDAKDRVIGHRLRRADGKPFRIAGTRKRKAITRKGDHNGILGPWPLADGGPALVTEGEFDAVAALSAGWREPLLATPGAWPGMEAEKILQVPIDDQIITYIAHSVCIAEIFEIFIF